MPKGALMEESVPATDTSLKREAPTLAEVAALAGVSPATASRVLNNSARVSPAARQQVRDAVTRLGYVRQRAARSTDPSRQAHGIAAIVCAPSPKVFSDPFYARVLDGAASALAPNDMPLLLAFGERPAALEKYLRGGHVSGVLLICTPANHGMMNAVASSRLPIMTVGRPMHSADLAYVDADNRGGARRAVEHLIASGRQRIATVAGPRDTAVGIDRLAGYRDALEAVERPPGPIAYGDFTRISGVHAMGRLLDHRPNLDAVFVASDLMAMGVLHALRRSGRRVPEDVAVIGFDDLPMSPYTEPPLSTVRQPVEELGAVAARRLLAIIDGRAEDSALHVLPTNLVLRRSG